ncbi:MAG TPA: glutamate--cysteine ligase [Amycolatopsis sp.]|uniref:carboxylate-amine ligase n=1 Tax=Amycolatopsis sp. TaxID=37632 RepID=UPI002B47260C|nr:glutamate--cysteine ligase [Amycolatopsis sp.]HKS45501.1 glutamate--cysteine ligase [Amycolatopsis sp.]
MPVLTVGVEEEFLLVDPMGYLSLSGPEVVRAARDAEGDLQLELARCQVESATGICRSAGELVGQLQKLRARLAAEACRRGLRVLPTATPLLAETTPPEISPTDRYRRMAAHFGAITSTGTTCGCHVHVGIPDRETAIAVSNHVRPWLPVLLALAANSPYNNGQDTRYCSWRHVLWSRWPSAGPPPIFASLDHYETVVTAMLRSEAMLDRGMIYWDIRLSERQPTLECRVSDVAVTAEEAALLGVLVRGLVGRALDSLGAPPPRPPQEVLRANLWRAARDGLPGSCLHPVNGLLVPVDQQLTELVGHVRPALAATHDDLEFVLDRLDRTRTAGGGAQRQRAAFAKRKHLGDVIEMLAVKC